MLTRSLLVTLLLSGVSVSSQQRSDISFTNRALEIRVLALEQPLSYKRLHQLEHGFEFEVLQSFASDYGYKLKVTSFKSQKELLKRYERGLGDIALARFSDFYPELKLHPRTNAYDTQKTALVCREDVIVELDASKLLSPKNKWRLLVNPRNSESRWVSQIKQQSPALKISTRINASSESLLLAIKKNLADCTLLDALEALYYKKAYPGLKLAKEISHAHNFFFLTGNPMLKSDFNKWSQIPSKKILIEQLRRNISGSTNTIEKNEFNYLAKAREEILPLYFEQFKKHSLRFGLPWQLVAAVAYQESHWNPAAISFTGVKGIMQITKDTAEFLGIGNREDSEQSIFGAYKYLRILFDRTPKYLPSIERLSLTLATYNVGPAHMIDAQNLAIKLGKNPYSWKDLKNVLPLLAVDEYQQHLKYGRARGDEPVQFVQRVLTYFDILKVQI